VKTANLTVLEVVNKARGYPCRAGLLQADANLTVLEVVNKASLPCSPPIPSFPPIREKGGDYVEFSRERISKETVCRGYP
jgi:hypothetical protein